jgi:hypothetical protein
MSPMNIIPKPRDRATLDARTVPLLINGDRMEQAEFHRRYEACAADEKFELVGGIVYMASPLRLAHGLYDEELAFLFKTYSKATPGVESAGNVTTILGEESEPQPDRILRILSEYGGLSGVTTDGYLRGPPELLAEVAHSSRAIDLHQKRADYEQAGVREYLVVCVEEAEPHWFNFASGGLITANRQGVYRSRVFPGLWIQGDGLLRRDTGRLEATLRQGLASREHAAFVKRLEQARRRTR